MKVDKQELLQRLQEILDRDVEDNFLTDDERWTIIGALSVIDALKEDSENE